MFAVKLREDRRRSE